MDEATGLVDHSDAVAVAVHPDAELSAVLDHRCGEVGHVLRACGVGRVVGERVVPVTVQRDRVNTQSLHQTHRERARHGVTAIDNDPHRSCRLACVIDDGIEVVVLEVLHQHVRASTLAELTVLEGPAQLLQLVPCNGQFAVADLEAVVLGWVVACGDGYRGLDWQIHSGAVQHSRGCHA